MIVVDVESLTYACLGAVVIRSECQAENNVIKTFQQGKVGNPNLSLPYEGSDFAFLRIGSQIF